MLIVDLDPQGNASTGLGIRHEAREVTVYDVLADEAPIEGAIIPTSVPGLFAVPSTIDLAGAEIELVSQFSRELRLRRALEPLRGGGFDFVFLDCPPSLGLLTVNALAAAEELIVPIQCEYYALEGLGQLLRNVRLVQQNVNTHLRLTGIVMTMFDARTKLSEQVVEEVRKYFGGRVYEAIIPRTVRLSEAPGFGQPITVYDPRSRGAESYRALAREVAGREPPAGEVPVLEELRMVFVPPPEAGTPGPEPPVEVEEDPSVEDGAAPSASASLAEVGSESVGAGERVVVQIAGEAESRAIFARPSDDGPAGGRNVEETRSLGRMRPGEVEPSRSSEPEPVETVEPEPVETVEEERMEPVQAAAGESRSRRWRLFCKGGSR